MGAPGFEPTDEQRKIVETSAGLGITHEDIRQLIINPNTGGAIAIQTLHNHFKKELEQGGAKAKVQIAESLFKQMRGGNVAAAIFLAKVRLNWSEKIIVQRDPMDSMSDDELDRELARTREALDEIRAEIGAAQNKETPTKSPEDISSLH